MVIEQLDEDDDLNQTPDKDEQNQSISGLQAAKIFLDGVVEAFETVGNLVSI